MKNRSEYKIYNKKQKKVRNGTEQLSRAIKMSRKIMYGASWVVDSKDRKKEKAAAQVQLKNQLAAALDQGFVLDDPMHPELRLLNQHNQFGLFNPDNRYHIATISTPGTYVIRGRRGTSARLEIQVGGGRPGFDISQTAPVPVSQMAGDDLIVDEDGNFEIVISDYKTCGNWLANSTIIDGKTVTANSVLIRESFMDWQSEIGGTWYIERCDTRGTTKPLPDLDSVNGQYARAAEYLVNSTTGWVNFVEGILQNIEVPNVLTPPTPTQDGGLPGQWNSAGFFPIEDDKAIIITVFDSPAQYQSIQIGDLWFNALDYCHRQNSLTMSQLRPNDTGCHKLVISRQDPRVANWLDPGSALTAFAFLRWQGLDEDHCFDDKPSAEVVNFNEIRQYLPDEPYFGPQERIKQLAERQSSCLQSPRGFK